MMKNWVDPEAKAEAERYDNPIPSRTLILETIEEKTALSHADLVEYFEIADQKSIDALSHRLIAMVRDGQLMKDGYKFQIAAEQPEHEATVYINSKGSGTANISGEDDLLLPERELRQVFNGDRVKVRQTSVDRKGKPGALLPKSCSIVSNRSLVKCLNMKANTLFSQPIQMHISQLL
jgi:Exoribonuclease R